MQSKHSIS